jgi:hypothetical protein
MQIDHSKEKLPEQFLVQTEKFKHQKMTNVTYMSLMGLCGGTSKPADMVGPI